MQRFTTNLCLDKLQANFKLLVKVVTVLISLSAILPIPHINKISHTEEPSLNISYYLMFLLQYNHSMMTFLFHLMEH